MKQNLLLSALLILLLAGAMPMQAENLVIQKLDQSERKQALETIGHLEFNHPERQMLLILKDGSVAETYAIDEVHKLYFDESEEAINQVFDNLSVREEDGRLIVDGANGSTVLRVFSMNGLLLMQQTGSSIGVESLSAGVYLLQCNQGIVKFIKH